MNTKSFRVPVLIEVRFQAPIGLQSDDSAVVVPKLREDAGCVPRVIELVQPFAMINSLAYEKKDVPGNPYTRGTPMGNMSGASRRSYAH